MMQKCSYCGAELPENSRFCGKCGRVQDAIASEQATTRSNTPQPYWTPESGTLPASLSSYPYSAPGTPPPPPPAENEDERRRAAAWPAQYGAGLGAGAMVNGGQPYNYGAPIVQGTPQIGSVPNVAGSPAPYTNAPAGQVAQGPAYQGPVTHYPPAGQQANPQAPRQGTAEQHPASPVKKHHERHARHAKHLHHTATGTTKAAGLKTMLIVVAAVVVVAAGGVATAAYFLNRPQPVISASSSYRVGNTLAGAVGTVLHISGQKFSSNSNIIFLLDGNPAPGDAGARSDSNGNFSANMPVTSAWSIGAHILTARDGGNNTTKNNISVMIVQPGRANTPGPNGAPPDDATFTINVTAKGTYALNNQPFNNTETVNITGHPDPRGGNACRDVDTGQPFTTHSVTLDTQTPFTESYSFSCQGSYKGGKVTYTETLVSDVIIYTTTGIRCTLASPQMNQQLTGSYTSQHTFSGTIVYGHVPQSDFHCTNPNSYFYYSGGQGSWTGTVGKL